MNKPYTSDTWGKFSKNASDESVQTYSISPFTSNAIKNTKRNFKIISHRGNLYGRDLENENKPTQIITTLRLGFNVEIDVWFINDKYYLGHDNPQYEVSIDFLKQSNLWLHCKNPLALEKLLQLNVNCFWHDKDEYTITSKRYIWTLVGKELLHNSIAVLLELNEIKLDDLQKCSGICTDEPFKYKNLLN